MRVRFKDCALSSAKQFRHLDAIIARVEVGAHEWDIDDPDTIEQSGWLAGAREYCKEVFEKATKTSSYPSSSGIHKRLVIVAAFPKEGEMDPDKASRYLSKPLRIIVENRFTDGAFLDCILRLLAPEKLRKLRVENNVPDLIEVDGAGGLGEVPKHVRYRTEEAAQEGLPIRIAVFTDSDSRYAGHQDCQVAAVESACQDHGVPCRILKKRSIENYIPDEALLAWAIRNASRQHIVSALIEMPDGIRDYFPIKRGLPAVSPSPDETAFYAPLQEPNRSTLRNGLGDIAIACFTDHVSSISAEALRRRDHGGDLDNLVQMIVDQL
ncbi:hypothetical protein [Arenibaculum sp.]|jgi:hypothetical protein|uniref:hypothetical protein n=1 Tax=Arenibaculum sp. TaxID=2865862 RepID=UPI002E0F7A61|nr:hypothetical protein [Arenibaculum sp.]